MDHISRTRLLHHHIRVAWVKIRRSERSTVRRLTQLSSLPVERLLVNALAGGVRSWLKVVLEDLSSLLRLVKLRGILHVASIHLHRINFLTLSVVLILLLLARGRHGPTHHRMKSGRAVAGRIALRHFLLFLRLPERLLLLKKPKKCQLNDR